MSQSKKVDSVTIGILIMTKKNTKTAGPFFFAIVTKSGFTDAFSHVEVALRLAIVCELCDA